MPVGTGSLKNSSCISGDFSSAAPTLYLRRNETPAAQPPIWPHPRRFTSLTGRAAFRALHVEPNITAPAAHMEQQLSRFMERHFGGGWQQPGAAPSRVLRILVGCGSARPSDESYELSVPADSEPITITAPTVLGVNWALESLSQLMTLDRDAAGGPQVVIEDTPILVQDKPRFPHRGFFVE